MALDNVAVKRFGEAAVRTRDFPLKLEFRNGFGRDSFQTFMRNAEVLRNEFPAVVHDDS